MIRNARLLRDFEDELARRTPADHRGNLRVAEALLEHARRLGVWPPADPLEGIEVDVRVARMTHVLRSA